MDPEYLKMIIALIGPTLAVTVIAAFGAVVSNRINGHRITELENRSEKDRQENREDHSIIKGLIIASKDETIREIQRLMEKM